MRLESTEMEMGYGATLPIPFLRALGMRGGARDASHGLNFSVVCFVALEVVRDGVFKISPRYIAQPVLVRNIKIQE